MNTASNRTDAHSAAPSHSRIRLLCTVPATLVLPLALLLCIQWPLREFVQAGSRQSNDVGQIVFALYVAVAVSAASWRATHLSVRSDAQTDRTRGLVQTGLRLLAVLPWAVWTLACALPGIVLSVRTQEKFSETLTPGYFLIRVALALLMVLVLLESCHALLRAWRARP